MKKIAPIAAIVLLGAMFTSCKKDHTCTCKDKDGKETGKVEYTKVKKSDAKKACDALSTTAAISGGSCGL